MILDKLVQATQKRLIKQKQQKSLEDVKREALTLPIDKNFPFEQTLSQQDINFICEVKKASPSKGIIAPDFPYLEIAKEYEQAGASAISVLTEPDYFLGSDTFLKEIAQNVNIPVLRKDFTIDEYQIYEAKILGASAILLICAILSEEKLKYFLQIANSLGLSCLVEAHDEAEIQKALNVNARIIGVNNRNLKDFSVDVHNSLKLRHLVPENIIFVSESGLKTAEDIELLRQNHVQAALIGETFMRALDKTAELSKLYGKMPPVQTKICGITRLEDISIINEVKPDYIGFIFTKLSHRYIAEDTAIKLVKNLNPQIKKVGVFVDEEPKIIEKLASKLSLDVVQLHGNEDEDMIRTIKQQTNVQVWKAVRVKSLADIEKWQNSSADMLLFDTYTENTIGGTGKTFNWQLLKNVKRKFILAGGLNIKNIARAIRTCKPYAVDISSGVETNYLKDERKIKQLMSTIRKVITMTIDTKHKKGRFGIHGGQYMPETLMNAVIELEEAYNKYKNDPDFIRELEDLQINYTGRPSLLYYAEKMSKDLGGAKIYLKREDLNHTGSHKLNNVLGQILLAKRMGKTRVIAETGAGQHGVATATAAALMGMECEIFMGKEDTERQALNVYRMELLGAKVHAVTSGTQTLKDAVNEALREWTRRIDDTHYVLGSVMGPHPFPTIVRDFQSVISREARQQILEKEGRLPSVVMACVGGGSNAMGMFYNFINDKDVKLIGCEAAGKGIDTDQHAATIAKGTEGIFHGMKSYFCQDKYGQIAPVYSISAGLDYPGIGPEHAYLHDIGRAQYVPITDDEAVNAFEYLSRTEGIIPAIESAHAVAHAMKIAPQMNKDDIIIICLSGRGDKDVAAMARYRGVKIHD